MNGWEHNKALVMDNISKLERNSDKLANSVGKLTESVARIDASLKVWVVVVPLFISTFIGLISIAVTLYMGKK